MVHGAAMRSMPAPLPHRGIRHPHLRAKHHPHPTPAQPQLRGLQAEQAAAAARPLIDHDSRVWMLGLEARD